MDKKSKKTGPSGAAKEASRQAETAGDTTRPQAPQAAAGPGLVGRLVKGVTQLGAIGLILAGGAFAALMISQIEASKPVVDGHGHGEEGGAMGGHDDHDDHGHGGHGEGAMERDVAFDETGFKNAGLVIEKAGPVVLRPKLTLNGVITPNEEHLVQVTPRFPGVVRAIYKRLASRVKKGDRLLSIESDESLKRYAVTSAIDGTVIARRVGLGEHVDRQDKLMVVADLSTVWVDFRVFPRDFKKLKLDQEIEISLSSGEPPIKAKIAYISPIAMADTQSMLARAVVDNPNGVLRPGLFVSGRVLLDGQKAFVAVRNEAIQYLDGKPVVFVEEKTKKGKRFTAKDVELGPSDGRYTEIYYGIVPGQAYVAGNSFMLKAELSKGMAAHSH